MKNTDDLTPQQIADAISQLPNVEFVRYLRGERRIMVQYPTQMGGRSYKTIPQAREHLAKMSVR